MRLGRLGKSSEIVNFLRGEEGSRVLWAEATAGVCKEVWRGEGSLEMKGVFTGGVGHEYVAEKNPALGGCCNLLAF